MSQCPIASYTRTTNSAARRVGEWTAFVVWWYAELDTLPIACCAHAGLPALPGV